MNKILLLDNFDSFTYNLYQQVQKLYKGKVEVIRNNACRIKDVYQRQFSAIIISPGPGRPENAGVSKALISEFFDKLPILGVCLGMQSINEVFGGFTIKSTHPVHGKADMIYNDGTGIFDNTPSSFKVARYHSLVSAKIPGILTVNCNTVDGIPMALQHGDYPVFGLQFHPESFMTMRGDLLIENFLNYVD